jgi:ferredoxin-NADP reductase
MLYQLAAEHSSRDIWWIHTSHTAAQHPFADESRQLLQTLARAHEHVFYTSGPMPAGTATTRGRVTAEALRRLRLPVDASAYLCGPAGFMTDVTDALVAACIDTNRIHTEMFGALAPINPGVTDVAHQHPHPPAGEPGTGPTITFARSGLTVPWSQRHRTLLELAEACDIPTRWSCRTGVCHTCATTVMSGDIAYDPAPLDPPPAGEALICCARARSDLVLDL